MARILIFSDDMGNDYQSKLKFMPTFYVCNNFHLVRVLSLRLLVTERYYFLVAILWSHCVSDLANPLRIEFTNSYLFPTTFLVSKQLPYTELLKANKETST